MFLKYLIYNIPIDLMLKVINKINGRTTFCKQFVDEKYIRYLKQINHNAYKVSEWVDSCKTRGNLHVSRAYVSSVFYH